MKERPILFSAPMVRALLNGSKTQTRRVVKPQPPAVFCEGDVAAITNGTRWAFSRLPERIAHPPGLHEGILCPYGQPGDRLWVREAFRLVRTVPGGADGDKIPPSMFLDSTRKFEADGSTSLPDGWMRVFGKLRPGIHMPRWASRITLEITGVRVERLQDISAADALAEGIVRLKEGFGLPDGSHFHATDPRQSYFSLWEAINGPGSVEANPWLWAVEFPRAEGAKP